MRTVEHWINGKGTPGASSRFAPVWNPATGEQQAQVVLGGGSDVDDAVRAAAAAFAAWSQASLSKRTSVLFNFREIVNRRTGQRKNEIAFAQPRRFRRRVGTNLVDVHLSRLRRKLDVPGGVPLLHTIRGAGFVLDEQPR